MAVLTRQDLDEAGLNATYAACGAGGDSVVNDGRTWLHVKNGSGGSLTVTVTAQVASKQTDGMGKLTRGNIAVAVPPAGERFIGPFGPRAFNDVNGALAITYSGVTSLTIAALHLPQI